MTIAPWGAEDSSIYAAWAAREDSIEEILARTDRLLASMGSALGTKTWTMPNGERWGTDPDRNVEAGRKVAAIRAEMLGDDPDEEPRGEGPLCEESPCMGCHFTVSGAGQGLHVAAQINAGAARSRCHGPHNHITVEITEEDYDAFTIDLADSLLKAVVSAWEPAAAAIRSYPVLAMTRREGWSLPIGYRTWISESVGPVHRTLAGIRIESFANGSYLIAPDEWVANEVITAILALFENNGLDQIPH